MPWPEVKTIEIRTTSGPGFYVEDVDKHEWHLWTEHDTQTNCQLDVPNHWELTRLMEPAPGRYCIRCFNNYEILSDIVRRLNPVTAPSPHIQPKTGRECPYMARDVCNKCGWFKETN